MSSEQVAAARSCSATEPAPAVAQRSRLSNASAISVRYVCPAEGRRSTTSQRSRGRGCMRESDEALSSTPSNRRFADLLAARLSRRTVLLGGFVAAGCALIGPGAAPTHRPPHPAGSSGSGVSRSGKPTRWWCAGLHGRGPLRLGRPDLRRPGVQGRREQHRRRSRQRQAGMHHDGIHFFPLPVGLAAARTAACSP